MDPRKLFKKKQNEQGSKIKEKEVTKESVSDPINFQDKKTGKTPVHDAIDADNLDYLQDLMNYKKTNADISDYDGNKPLHYAAKKERSDFLLALGMVETDPLIETNEIQYNRFKLSINAKNKEGNTALHHAASINTTLIEDLKNVRLLVENGADVNVQNDQGETPLHLAVMNCDEELVSYLLSVGANAYLKTKYGANYENIAFYYAAERGLTELLKSLLHYNASTLNKECIHAIKIALRNKHTETAMRIIKLSMLPDEDLNFELLDEKNTTDETDFIKAGDNLLHYAVRTKNIEFVNLASQRCKMLINEPNAAGVTPGHLAIQLNFTDVVALMHKYCEIKSVVETEDKKASSNIYSIAAKSGISSLKELINLFPTTPPMPTLKNTKRASLIQLNPSEEAAPLNKAKKLSLDEIKRPAVNLPAVSPANSPRQNIDLHPSEAVYQFSIFTRAQNPNSTYTSGPLVSSEVTGSVEELKETSKVSTVRNEVERQDTISSLTI